MSFSNRTYKENPNRKKLTIISQTANTIIADITNASEIENEGTPITAEVMNSFETNINQACTNANNASLNATNALTIANNAKTQSQSAINSSSIALSNSEQAITISNEAKNKALEVEGKLADRGAIIKINNTSVAEILFSSDPQQQIDSKISKNFNTYASKTTLANDDIFVIQDSSSGNNANVLFSTIKNEIINLLYPIGTIYLSTNSNNPKNYLGGEWVCWGAGRMPLGIGNNGETYYTTVEQCGGSENSIAVHSHTQTSHSHGLLSPNDGNYWSANANSFSNPNNSDGYVAAIDIPANYGQQYCNTNNNSANYVQSIQPSINNSGTIGGNMPPYITCYMWKRIS